MNLSQYAGDDVAHSIPMEWDGFPFIPGLAWDLAFNAVALPDAGTLAIPIQKTKTAGITVSGASIAKVKMANSDTAGLPFGSLSFELLAFNFSTQERRCVSRGYIRIVPSITIGSGPVNDNLPAMGLTFYGQGITLGGQYLTIG